MSVSIDNILIDDDELVCWGYKPALFDKLGKTSVKIICGDLDSFMGVVNDEGQLSVFTAEEEDQILENVVQAAYSQQLLFILTGDGEVYQYDRRSIQQVQLPFVKKISGSPTGMLFLTQSEVCGLGSNKLSQLGMDYQQQQVTTPTMIEYFCGFQQITDIACGPFHSAVIVDGEVYTFGWSKEGRLGWGLEDEEKDGIISFATFLDVNEQPIDIHAIKVVCGSSHTFVLDSKISSIFLKKS